MTRFIWTIIPDPEGKTCFILVSESDADSVKDSYMSNSDSSV